MVTLKGAAISYCHYTHNSDTRGGVSHTPGAGEGHSHTHTHKIFNTAGLTEGASVVKPPLTDDIKGEREKLEPSASVELVLEFNPVRDRRVIIH